ncbi:hypothetical protein ACU5P1_04715 [Pseudomonas plecoglossicida]|uniref:Uncharacterized protein n=1 Tax=Pseudomonas plecoglossicida TaxID=70775 RepID=A0AAD0R0K4_PSEDL|nr:hypothetical protein [Pseudomonas plecoglossicida]AXM98016.1 hypothetical protein DVB73_20655 [Pseudomonas plecoglossicida]EPB96057.1 hypothetical protein L321_10214 [Pseudomonas plecoglossicida NB2011]
MKHRGSQYWFWSDSKLPDESHEESLSNGLTIEVRARLSRKGITQLFIGIYTATGVPAAENYFDNRPNETVSQALSWGLTRARAMATSPTFDGLASLPTPETFFLKT